MCIFWMIHNLTKTVHIQYSLSFVFSCFHHRPHTRVRSVTFGSGLALHLAFGEKIRTPCGVSGFKSSYHQVQLAMHAVAMAVYKYKSRVAQFTTASLRQGKETVTVEARNQLDGSRGYFLTIRR